ISLPTEDKYLTTRSALMHQMAMTLGGRAAEEIVFHEVTTGAANDLEKITSMAKQMIMRFGMSEKLGPRVLGKNFDQPFLGRDYGAEADYSEEIAREIDDEIRRVIEESHELALAVLREHMDELHKISAILIERETIDRDQYERLLAGEDEAGVSPDEAPAEPESPEPQPEPKRERPRPRPFPLPGSAMQGPDPDPASQQLGPQTSRPSACCNRAGSGGRRRSPGWGSCGCDRRRTRDRPRRRTERAGSTRAQSRRSRTRPTSLRAPSSATSTRSRGCLRLRRRAGSRA